MAAINDINQFENYLNKKNKSDQYSLWLLSLFFLMALAIVVYATKYQKIKKESEFLQMKNQELEDMQSQSNARLQDTLQKVQEKHKFQWDSLTSSFSNFVELQDQNSKYLKEEYDRLIALAKSNSQSASKKIEAAQKVIEKKSADVIQVANEVIDKANEYKADKAKQQNYSIYIQYMVGKDKDAQKTFNQLNSSKGTIKMFTVAKPEMIKSKFNNAIKYFHEKDKSEAIRLAKSLKFPVPQFVAADYSVPNGQIEIWIGN